MSLRCPPRPLPSRSSPAYPRVLAIAVALGGCAIFPLACGGSAVDPYAEQEDADVDAEGSDAVYANPVVGGDGASDARGDAKADASSDAGDAGDAGDASDAD